MTFNEDCFFFYNKKGQYLYGCSYLPLISMSETGIVIVPPVGHERLRCYRECVNLARDLADAGFAVMRFDYRGEGESFGEFEDFDVSSRLDDICVAADELKKRSGVKNICLLGFRLGALFSIMAAKNFNCTRLILCEPIFDTRKYVRNLIRAHIITVKEYFSDIKIKSEDVLERLEKGDAVSVYGFHVPANYLQQLENINIGGSLDDFHGNIYFIGFCNKAKEKEIPNSLRQYYEMINFSGTCKWISVQTPFSWMTKKMWMDRISGLADKVIMAIEAWDEKP